MAEPAARSRREGTAPSGRVQRDVTTEEVDMRVWQIPLRLATGAYILNSGLEKSRADAEQAAHMQGFAAGAFPQVKQMSPEEFSSLMSTAEIGVGTMLLAPVVSARRAGLALGALSSALLTMYWRTPGLHREHDPRPTPDGVPMAKDVWMLGIAAALFLGSFGRRRR
jgi:hypothetical protein